MADSKKGNKSGKESDIFEQRLKESEESKKIKKVSKKEKNTKKITPIYTENKPLPQPKKYYSERNVKSFEDTSSSRKLLLVIFMLFIFLLILIFIYFYFRDVPLGEESVEVPVVINKTLDVVTETTGPVKQFYTNMKFNHNNISYSINSDCNINHRTRMIEAFSELSKQVDSISFSEINSDDADIEVICPSDGSSVVPEEENDFFVAGEGGARQIIQTKRYNIIKNGAILLYENPENKLVCGWPNVELHELIHVFGFNHSISEDSLMYPILKTCDQKLDSSIVKDLKRLYSEKNLPDLYFDDINVVKKGKLIDFNLTVRNSGSVPSNLANFSIYDSEKLLKTSSLGNVNYGAGVFVQIVNFKLNSRASDKISFVIDSENNILEIDEKNNRVDIDLK